MIDHLVLLVTDIAASKRFYAAALAPLGYTFAFEDGEGEPGGLRIVGFSVDSRLEIILRKVPAPVSPVHVAFAASDRSLVDGFYSAAMAAGGRDNGSPGLCPEYHPDYYGGFVLDPDGHNIEAVCHKKAL